MPKFSFNCLSCKTSSQKYVTRTQVLNCDLCGQPMQKSLPLLSGPAEVRETINTHTGTTWRKDQQEIIQERKDDYFWSVEVPRLVQTYCLETCLEQGWCYVDDDNKVQIHTKPPHKR